MLPISGSPYLFTKTRSSSATAASRFHLFTSQNTTTTTTNNNKSNNNNNNNNNNMDTIDNMNSSSNAWEEDDDLLDNLSDIDLQEEEIEQQQQQQQQQQTTTAPSQPTVVPSYSSNLNERLIVSPPSSEGGGWEDDDDDLFEDEIESTEETTAVAEETTELPTKKQQQPAGEKSTDEYTAPAGESTDNGAAVTGYTGPLISRLVRLFPTEVAPLSEEEGEEEKEQGRDREEEGGSNGEKERASSVPQSKDGGCSSSEHLVENDMERPMKEDRGYASLGYAAAPFEKRGSFGSSGGSSMNGINDGWDHEYQDVDDLLHQEEENGLKDDAGKEESRASLILGEVGNEGELSNEPSARREELEDQNNTEEEQFEGIPTCISTEEEQNNSEISLGALKMTEQNQTNIAFKSPPASKLEGSSMAVIGWEEDEDHLNDLSLGENDESLEATPHNIESIDKDDAEAMPSTTLPTFIEEENQIFRSSTVLPSDLRGDPPEVKINDEVDVKYITRSSSMFDDSVVSGSQMAIIGWDEDLKHLDEDFSLDNDDDEEGLEELGTLQEDEVIQLGNADEGVTEPPSSIICPMKEKGDEVVESDVVVANPEEETMKEGELDEFLKPAYEFKHADSELAVMGWDEDEKHLNELGMDEDEDLFANIEEGPTSMTCHPIPEVELTASGEDENFDHSDGEQHVPLSFSATEERNLSITHADSELAVVGWDEDEKHLNELGMDEDEDFFANIEEGPTSMTCHPIPEVELTASGEDDNFNHSDGERHVPLSFSATEERDLDITHGPEMGDSQNGMEKPEKPSFPDQNDFTPRNIQLETKTNDAITAELPTPINHEASKHPLDDLAAEEQVSFGEGAWDEENLNDLDLGDEEQPSVAEQPVSKGTFNRNNESDISERLLVPPGTGEQTEEGWNEDVLDDLDLEEEEEQSKEQIEYRGDISESKGLVIPPGTGEETTERQTATITHTSSKDYPASEPNEEGWDEENLNDLNLVDEEQPLVEEKPCADRMPNNKIAASSDKLLVPPGTGEETEEGWGDDDLSDLNLENDVKEEEKEKEKDEEEEKEELPAEEKYQAKVITNETSSLDRLAIPPGDSGSGESENASKILSPHKIEEGITDFDDAAISNELAIPSGDSEEGSGLNDLRTNTNGPLQHDIPLRNDVDELIRNETAKRSSLEKELRAKEDKVLEMESYIQTVRERESGLIKEMDTCKDQLSTYHQEKESLVQMLNEKDAVISDLQQRQSQMDENASMLQKYQHEIAQLKTEVEEINHLKLELDSKSSLCDQFHAQLQELQNQSNLLTETEARYKDQIRQLNEASDALAATASEEIKTLETKLKSKYTACDQLQSELKELQSQLTKMESDGFLQSKDFARKSLAKEKEIEGLRKQLSDAMKECHSISEEKEKQNKTQSDKIASLNEEIEKLVEKNQSLAHDAKAKMELTKKVEHGNETIAKLEKQISNVNIEKDELKWKYKDVTSQSNQQRERIQSLIQENDLNKEKTSQQTNLSQKLTHEIQSMKKEMKEIKSVNRQLKHRCNELERVHKEEIQEKDETEAELREEIQIISEEKEQLDIDNEELLVQLGYIRQIQEQEKEEYERQIERLQEQISGSTFKVDPKEIDALKNEKDVLTETVKELEERLSQSRKLKDHDQETMKSLSDENTNLRNQISALTTQSSQKDEQIQNLTRENKELAEQLDELDMANLANENDDNVSLVNKYEERCQRLSDQCSAQKKQIDLLSLEMKQAKEALSSTSGETEADTAQKLDVRIQNLIKSHVCEWEKIKEKERLVAELLEKETTLAATLDRKEKELIDQKQHMDDYKKESFEYKDQVDSMRKSYDEMKAELRAKRDRVQALEVDLLNSELNLDAKKQDSEILQMQKKKVKELEQTLKQKNAKLDELSMKKTSTEAQLLKVRGEFEGHQLKSGTDVEKCLTEIAALKEALSERDDDVTRCQDEIGALKDALEQRDGEIRQLKKQMVSMQDTALQSHKLIAATDEMKKTLSAKEQEIDSLRQTLEQKDEKVKELEIQNKEIKETLETIQKHLDSEKENHEESKTKLSNELTQNEEAMRQSNIQIEVHKGEIRACQLSLAAKEKEISLLVKKLEEHERVVRTQQATADLLKGASSKDEAESIDVMRNQIVSLAHALERAEMQRAEALERVVKERKSNAESLRRLGENVKRFYATLSCDGSA